MAAHDMALARDPVAESDGACGDVLADLDDVAIELMADD